MVGLPLLTFCFGGGGLGGVAHLTQNNVALQKVFFFLQSGVEELKLFSCGECLCLLTFLQKICQCCFSILFREFLITLKMSSYKISH